MTIHKKRKNDDKPGWSRGKKKQRLSSNQPCSLQTSAISNIGNFTSFIMCKTSPDEKLKILHNTRDRRLKQKASSKHYMQDAWKLIKDFLSNIYLDNTGWYREYHQCFTMNLNRLQQESQVKLEDAQKKVINLYFHMKSAYFVTRKQQHLEGKCSSQLSHLPVGAIKSLGRPILNRW